ncbi:hypothetical protein A1O3_07722 [Capronia epimyces CBS 606.96]|uniref:NACHT domain-containing protein n=1 Tax=Capronia epimyces CBS 606.96 TaxID=1182542 RepID=W9XVR9_9EURO|nr:uncharacterized protein A1O3_07722 [Capronia epimyces CBS 606.96]EXJ81430.1 hypothetical protein A1O3_07722 [Capronia epimyces CBS 606.96]
MDPLSAIGLASNILSFIDFSCGVVKHTYEVYNSATGATSANAHIKTVIDDLAKATEALGPEVEATTKHSKALHELAQKCSGLSEDLLRILKKLQVTRKNSKWQSLRKTLRAAWSEKEVASIEKRLDSYRSEIIMRLQLMLHDENSSTKSQLDSIGEASSKLKTQSADKFSNLRDKLDDALQTLGADKTATLKEIRQDLCNLQSMASIMPRETQILRGLYFESMYTREDTVVTAESTTFTWMVEAEDWHESVESAEDLDRLSSGSDADAQENLSMRSPSSIAGTEDSSTEERDSPHNDSETVSSDDAPSFQSERIHAYTWKERKEREEMDKRNQIRSFFADWLQFGRGVFYISGKAGSGKSTLMKFLSRQDRVKENLQRWAGGKKLVFAQFFFWSSGNKLQMSVEGLYRSLLFEVLKQCPELIAEVFPDVWKRSGRGQNAFEGLVPRFPEIEAAFNALIATQSFPSHRFCFFIDGLDEYEGDSVQHWELAGKIQQWAKSNDIKFCVSSRPHTEFMKTFPDEANLRIRLHEVTSNDIRRFASSMFEKDVNFRRVSDLYLELVDDIVRDANGVFLWARLVVRSLLEGVGRHYSAAALRERLATVPKDLGQLFDQLLGAIHPADRKLSDKIFLLVSYSEGLSKVFSIWPSPNVLMFSWLEDLEDPTFPFTLPVRGYSDAEIVERHEAMRCRIDGLSRGLLEMVPTRESDLYFKYRVQFFHRSVQDYLGDHSRQSDMQNRVPNFNPVEDYFRLQLAEFKFARTSSKQLTIVSPLYDNLVQTIVLLHKAASRRLKFDILEGYGKALESHRRLPFSHPQEIGVNTGKIHWCQTIPYSTYAMDKALDFSYLHCLSFYGHHEYLHAKVQETNALLRSSGCLNLLLSASVRRESETVRVLLEDGANPNEDIDIYERSADADDPGRCRASIWMVFLADLATTTIRRFAILEILLKYGADRDVFFLLSPRQKHGRNSEALETPSNSELVSLSLQQWVDAFGPPNHQAIKTLLLEESPGSGWWSQLRRAVSSFGHKSMPVVQKYKVWQPDDMRWEDYEVHSVCSKTAQLHIGFLAQMY